jgi:hypothetical protein
MVLGNDPICNATCLLIGSEQDRCSRIAVIYTASYLKRIYHGCVLLTAAAQLLVHVHDRIPIHSAGCSELCHNVQYLPSCCCPFMRLIVISAGTY